MPPQSRARHRRPLTASISAAVAIALVAGGCGGSSPARRAGAPTTAGRALSPAQLLAAARRVIDRTQAVHFALTSSGVPSSGTQLIGGSGDLLRPASLEGTFDLTQSGVPASVKVISIGSAFYVQLPLSSSYTKVSPSEFGFGNPAELISPTSGVSALLSDAAPGARALGQRRLSGELVEEVTGTVPGAKVPVLPDADPARPVTLTVDVVPGTDQVRRVVLAGPFTSKTSTTTYTVTLTDYGEHVTVTAPTG